MSTGFFFSKIISVDVRLFGTSEYVCRYFVKTGKWRLGSSFFIIKLRRWLLHYGKNEDPFFQAMLGENYFFNYNISFLKEFRYQKRAYSCNVYECNSFIRKPSLVFDRFSRARTYSSFIFLPTYSKPWISIYGTLRKIR